MKPFSEEFEANLKELQAIDFTLTELALYLDTHQGDTQALQQYDELIEKRNTAKEAVEKEYGPLRLQDTANKEDVWKWSQGPWPWQI